MANDERIVCGVDRATHEDRTGAALARRDEDASISLPAGRWAAEQIEAALLGGRSDVAEAVLRACAFAHGPVYRGILRGSGWPVP